jgi:hypothetical protein
MTRFKTKTEKLNESIFIRKIVPRKSKTPINNNRKFDSIFEISDGCNDFLMSEIQKDLEVESELLEFD